MSFNYFEITFWLRLCLRNWVQKERKTLINFILYFTILSKSRRRDRNYSWNSQVLWKIFRDPQLCTSNSRSVIWVFQLPTMHGITFRIGNSCVCRGKFSERHPFPSSFANSNVLEIKFIIKTSIHSLVGNIKTWLWKLYMEWQYDWVSSEQKHLAEGNASVASEIEIHINY